MSRRLVDYDPVSGIAHFSEWSDLDDAIRFTAVQDADPITDHNAYLRSVAPKRHGDGMTHMLKLPMPLWTLLKSVGILDDKVALQRWMADPDHRKFLVR
jgi:hypothetical protein